MFGARVCGVAESLGGTDRAPPLLQAARTLLTLDEKDPKRVFEGEALLRRMLRYKLLPEDEKRLDFVLQLTTQKLLERRLQTLVRSLCVCCVLCCASAGAVPALALWSGLRAARSGGQLGC